MLTTLDWSVVTVYLVGLVAMSLYLSRRQETAEDYFVAGNSGGPVSIALSVMATQCSTNSILGAPAFVAFVVGGGLVWLQYELALPLAMVFIAVFLGKFRGAAKLQNGKFCGNFVVKMTNFTLQTQQ